MDCAWLCDKHKRNNQCFFCKKNINNTFYPYKICYNCKKNYGNELCSNTYKCFICYNKNFSPKVGDLQSLYLCENCYKQENYLNNFGVNHCYKCGSKLS